VPESVMPKYGYLERRMLDENAGIISGMISAEHIGDIMQANAMVGVPYSEEMLENARADFMAQTDPDGDFDGLLERYGENVNIRNFDGQPGVSEADALIAYIQMLGTLVDFSTFTPDASR
jgi:cytochrome c oxidase cbb3-type subunit 2